MAGTRFVPETRDTERTWRNICVRADDIIRNRDTINPSQLSLLMGDLHRALFFGNFVEQDPEEIELENRVRLLKTVVTPIHNKVCNAVPVSDYEWKKLELFINANRA